jgi:hypothetical protein
MKVWLSPVNYIHLNLRTRQVVAILTPSLSLVFAELQNCLPVVGLNKIPDKQSTKDRNKASSLSSKPSIF